MNRGETIRTSDRMRIVVNGKTINLRFQQEPNELAADYIKQTLIRAYTVKVI